MSDQFSYSLWSGLKGLIERLQAAPYWTQRRDACEELLAIARQAVARLRMAAVDSDPDVSHWGKQSCEHLLRDLQSTPAEELMENIASQLDKQLAACSPEGEAAATATAAVAPPVAAPAPASAPLEGCPADAQALLDWLAGFAREQKGTWEARPTGGLMVLPVENNRRQTLYIDVSSSDSEQVPVVLIYSICGEVEASTCGWALEANSRLSRGAFATIKHKDRDVLVLMLRRRIRELPWATLPKKLLYIAQKADWAEAQLKDEDRH